MDSWNPQQQEKMRPLAAAEQAKREAEKLASIESIHENRAKKAAEQEAKAKEELERLRLLAVADGIQRGD